MLWEVTKCFLRGNCISYSAKVKASRNKRFEELEKKIHDLECQLARAFSDKLNQELSLLKAEYASLYPKLSLSFTELSKNTILMQIGLADCLH